MKKDISVSFVRSGKLTRGGWLSIIAFLLIAIIALSVALGLVVKAGKDEQTETEASIGGEMILSEGTEGEGLSLLSAVIPEAEYEAYGIMPTAMSAQQLRATVTPSDSYVPIDWAVAWKEGTSGKWGNGKTVTDYVTVVPTEDGALTANVSCLKEFGEQIVITASVRGNATKKATCNVDYAAPVKGVSIEFKQSGSTAWTAVSSGYSGWIPKGVAAPGEASYKLDIEFHYTYGETYTLMDTFTCDSFTVALTSNFISELKSFAALHTDLYGNLSGITSLINGLTTEKKTVTVSEGFPDLRNKVSMGKFLFTSGFSSMQVTQMNPLMAAFMQDENYNWRQTCFEYEGKVQGKYSSYSFKLLGGFQSDYFEVAVNSVTLNSEGLVFGA